MAQKIEVEVEIGRDGEVQLRVKGVKGKGCVDVAKALEQAVGEVLERKPSSEYYEPERVLQTKRTR
jgi:hypothetical protein